MRFTSIFVAGAFATMAAAQSKTASVSPAQQSQMDCLADCDDGDVKCQSYCITVPSPNEANVNATNECVAACPKGKGSEADTEKYSVCLQDCISDNYWKTIDGTPRGTDTPDVKSKVSEIVSSAVEKATNTASAAESDATATGASETSDSEETSASGTATGTAAEVSETGNAAPALVGGVSLLGLAAAIFAL